MLKLCLFCAILLRKLSRSKRHFLNYKTRKLKIFKKIIGGESKAKPRLNMTMKGLSRKQVIVPMNTENITMFMKELSAHITNINRALKNIKLEIMADFVQSDNKSIIITTNKVKGSLNLQTIKMYIKNINSIESNQVEALNQYSIIGILYYVEETKIILDIVEKIIKDNHIFNDIVLTLRLRIIKVLPKSDMSII